MNIKSSNSKETVVQLMDGEITYLRPIKYYPAWKNLRDIAAFVALLGILLWALLAFASSSYQSSVPAVCQAQSFNSAGCAAYYQQQ